ncbi:MAG TPA: biotin/lipoyl-containing protein, partial [Acidimicrobiales bacterium]|nr:biotin/lipoyl-containing protein [Acidimicrobiales bacterium]
SVVDVDYDSMLAKVVVHGASRAEATAGLARVLRRSLIHGPRTNRDLLVAVLADPDFAAGRFDTAFLERHPPSALLPPPGRRELEVAGVAAALAQATEARRSSRILGAVPSGFRNNPSQPQSRRYESGGVELTVEYRLDTRPARLGVDGTDLADLALAEDPRPDRVTLVDRGVRRDFTVEVDDGTAFVDGPTGAFELRVLPRFPEARSELAAGSLVAPMPGRVVRVEVVVGDLVRAGQALVVIEAMKMEHRISAPDEGTVSEVRAEVGARVDVGDVLAVIE